MSARIAHICAGAAGPRRGSACPLLLTRLLLRPWVACHARHCISGACGHTLRAWPRRPAPRGSLVASKAHCTKPLPVAAPSRRNPGKDYPRQASAHAHCECACCTRQRGPLARQSGRPQTRAAPPAARSGGRQPGRGRDGHAGRGVGRRPAQGNHHAAVGRAAQGARRRRSPRRARSCAGLPHHSGANFLSAEVQVAATSRDLLGFGPVVSRVGTLGTHADNTVLVLRFSCSRRADARRAARQGPAVEAGTLTNVAGARQL